MIEKAVIALTIGSVAVLALSTIGLVIVVLWKLLI